MKITTSGKAGGQPTKADVMKVNTGDSTSDMIKDSLAKPANGMKKTGTAEYSRMEKHPLKLK